MKISIYARALTRKPTGRGFLAHELTRALQEIQGLQIQAYVGESFEWPGVDLRPARGSNFVSDAWRTLRGIGRDVRRENPDVFWSATHVLPSGLPRSVPKVVTLLDLVWRDHPETMNRLRRMAAGWMERGLHRADRIVCISKFTRDRLGVHFPGLESKATVMHLAANPRLRGMAGGDVLKRLGIDTPYLINVDTVEPRKNLSILLDAMARLPELQLVQCGGLGWNVDDLVRRAKSIPNVRLLGYVPEADLAGLYRGATAAVFPSVYEGFHLPPLDAASLGCPLVVSDIPVHREVLGDAATYFGTSDVDGLVAILQSLARTDGRTAWASRVQDMERRYSWKAAAERLLGVFGETTRNPGA